MDIFFTGFLLVKNLLCAALSSILFNIQSFKFFRQRLLIHTQALQ